MVRRSARPNKTGSVGRITRSAQVAKLPQECPVGIRELRGANGEEFPDGMAGTVKFFMETRLRLHTPDGGAMCSFTHCVEGTD